MYTPCFTINTMNSSSWPFLCPSPFGIKNFDLFSFNVTSQKQFGSSKLWRSTLIINPSRWSLKVPYILHLKLISSPYIYCFMSHFVHFTVVQVFVHVGCFHGVSSSFARIHIGDLLQTLKSCIKIAINTLWRLYIL